MLLKKKYKSLLTDFYIFSIGTFGSKLVLFLLVPLYTNYLTTIEYGISDLVFTVSQLLIPIISLSIYNSVLRFGLSQDTRPEDSLLIGLIVTIVASIFSLFLVPLIGQYPTLNKWKWYIYIYVILNIISLCELSYIKAKGKNLQYAFISIIQAIVLATTSIILVMFLGLGIKGYFLANIVASAVIVIVSFYSGHIFTAIKRAKYKHSLVRQMIAYSTPLIINDISWWAIQSSDKLIIEILIGPSSLGLYTVATKIPTLLKVLSSIFIQAWNISAVREIESTNDKKYYVEVFDNYAFVLFFSAMIIISISKIFMGFYVGSEFLESWHFVPILVICAVFAGISSYFGSMYGALKKNLNSMVTTVSSALLNITLNLVFIKLIGIYGALIGSIVSYFVISTVRMIDVMQILNIDFKKNKYILSSFIIIGQAIFVMSELYASTVSLLSILFLIIIYRRIALIQKVLSFLHP